MEYTDKILNVAQTIVDGMKCLKKNENATGASGAGAPTDPPLKTLDARDTAEEIQERVKAKQEILKKMHNANERDALVSARAASRAASRAAAARAHSNFLNTLPAPPAPGAGAPPPPPPAAAKGVAMPVVPLLRDGGGRRIIPTVRLTAAHHKGRVAFPGTRRTVNKRTNTKRRSTYRR